MQKVILFILGFIIVTSFTGPEWGFYGHRKINRMSVFTLPPEMLGFYKKNIEYITEHAVDPDKRRYATKHEAVRHYIDVDHWGTYPFDNVPRQYVDAVLKFGELFFVDSRGDSTIVDLEGTFFDHDAKDSIRKRLNYALYTDPDSPWNFDVPSKNGSICIKDKFSEFGILPYWLLRFQRQLTKAFERKDSKTILRISADMGHYIGDAHVPLHTTENYNGYMSDQVGIHAFWESRIPELFAEEEFDFYVGKAEYIENKREYFWDVVLESHSLLDEVLGYEKELSKTFPEDKQWCYDERLDRTIRIQCPEYAEAYKDAMKGMVEERMRDAILSIGSVWYTSWVDAGQPDLEFMRLAASKDEKKSAEELNQLFKSGSIKGREHDNGRN